MDASRSSNAQFPSFRRPHGRLAVAIALTLAPVAPGGAAGQTAPDARARPIVSAVAGFDGRWTVGRWAPVRLVFDDPGPADRVELSCVEGGPVFRFEGVPAATGRSTLDGAVYAVVASKRWTVRLSRPGGRVEELSVALDADFTGYELAVPPGAPPDASGASFAAPPWEMRIAAATRLAGDLETIGPDRVADFLATGRGFYPDPDPSAPAGQGVSQSATFGPAADGGLADPEVYRVLWRDDMARWLDRDRKLPLLVLAGGVLAILAVVLLLRGRPVLTSVLAGCVLLLTAGGLWRMMAVMPPTFVAEMELSVRPGAPPAAGGEGVPAPLRRTRWIGLAAVRGGTYSLPASRPTPRLIVTGLADRPDLTLPAAWAPAPRPDAFTGELRLERGQFWAFDATEYTHAAGTMRLVRDGGADAEKLVWGNWRPALHDAWLVADTRAVPLGRLDSGDGERAIDPAAATAWSAVYAPSPGDERGAVLGKRLIEYWSTRTPRGGRRWVVGFASDAGDASPPVRVHHVRLWAVDLGPIAASPASAPEAGNLPPPAASQPE